MEEITIAPVKLEDFVASLPSKEQIAIEAGAKVLIEEEHQRRAADTIRDEADLLGPEDRALRAEALVDAFYKELHSIEGTLLRCPVKIGIQGPGRSGKDEAAEWLVNNTMLKFAGTTSTVISRQIAYEDNVSFEVAHEYRHTQRPRWRAKGDWMRRNDPSRLAKLVSVGSNIVAGVRADIEMIGVLDANLLDINFWIDRPGIEKDPTQGFGPELCHVIVPNWWGVSEYLQRWAMIAKSYGWMKK